MSFQGVTIHFELLLQQDDSPVFFSPHFSSSSSSPVTANHCLVALDLSKGATSSNSKSAPIAGCTFYHQIASSRVASIGACSSAGARAALEDVLIMPGEKPSGIAWMSAGEETVVYIGGVPYALRTISSAMVPVTSEGGGDAQNGLKADVLAEVSSYGGRMVVFDASGVPRWITVVTGTVLTPAEAIAGTPCKGTPIAFTSLPVPSKGPLPLETLNSFMDDVLSKLSPNSCLVLSSAGESESAALLTVISTICIRVRDAGGKMPPDVTPKEPLPVVSKYKPERGLLEDVPQVTSLVSALGVELGGSAKLLADDTIDRAHLCKLKHMRDVYISSKDSSSLAQYLQVVAVAAMLLSPPEKRAEIGDAFSASMAPPAAA